LENKKCIQTEGVEIAISTSEVNLHKRFIFLNVYVFGDVI